MSAFTGPGVLPRRTIALMWVRLAAANLVGAVLVFVFFQRIAPPDESLGRVEVRDAISLGFFLAYLAIVVAVVYVVGERLYGRQYRWAIEGRTPTAREREVALREPFRIAAGSFSAWVIGAVVFSVLNLAFGNSLVIIVRLSVGVVFGGLATCMLTFLLVERSLRPVFAVVLRGTAHERRRYLGIRPRLMLTWGLGSGVPLIGIAFATVGPNPPTDPTGPVAFLVGVGVVGGFVSMYAAARSVAEPVESVRAAVKRVEQGDLDAEVTVDDGGEVGLLQSGFNQMVVGLRERHRLRDLFGRHVGDEVARQALERGVGLGLGGEQRDASALFIDLIGSTELASNRPATEVVAILNALFDAVVRTAAAEGGWVNKFEGDGALCVFGAPADQPDHAARALRAACALRAELDRMRADNPALSPLDAGIGVSSGRVVAGNVGAEERYEYTVIGDPVNEAARLTVLAKDRPERLLASEHAVRQADGAAADWTVVGEFALRGRGAKTCAYAPAPRTTPAPAAADVMAPH